MRIIKCDLCEKDIKGEPVIAGLGLLNGVELCEKCGLPALKFLKSKSIVYLNTQRRKIEKSP